MSPDIHSPPPLPDASDLKENTDSIKDEQNKHRDELVALLAEGKRVDFSEIFDRHLAHLEAAVPDARQTLTVTMDILEDVFRGLKGLQSCRDLESDVLECFLSDVYRTLQKMYKILSQSFECKELRSAMRECDAHESNQEKTQLEYLLYQVKEIRELFDDTMGAYTSGHKTLAYIFFDLAHVLNGTVNPELYKPITDTAIKIEESNTIQLQWMCGELSRAIKFYGTERHRAHPQLAIIDLMKGSPREKAIGMYMISNPEIFDLLMQASADQKLVTQITPQIKQLLTATSASRPDILEGVTWL
jgi:hypothetical protein